jgi:molecular chaperone GrpE
MSSDHIPNPDSGDTTTSEDVLRQERDELRDRLLRNAAEFDNYRKRTDRERRELSEYAASELIKDLLPVMDDLERALNAPVEDTPGAAAVRDGIAIVRRQFLDVLQRRGVEPLDVIGADFNPEWHEALAKEPLEGRREGEIIAEIRRGYRIGQRLLRPALVKVAQS